MNASPHRFLEHKSPNTTTSSDPYSQPNGDITNRDEIQRINKEMMTESGSNYCQNGGKMQLVYKDISLTRSKTNQFDQKYICICPYNFMGTK